MRKPLLWAIALLFATLCFVFWASQTLTRVILIGHFSFQKNQPMDGILTATEASTLGGSRGDQIRCSAQQECFALGVVKGEETMFVAKAGQVTVVKLNTPKNEAKSRAFSVSRNGKYWWTTDRGVIRRRPNTLKEREYTPGTEKIIAYRRDGTIQQQWRIGDGEAVFRMERLGDDSILTLQSDGSFYRYQLGQTKPKPYPRQEIFNLSAIIGDDGFIWSPGPRAADKSISLLGISLFAPASSKPIQVNYPDRKFWTDLIEGSREQGVFMGFGGTLNHMSVDWLRPDGQVENVVRIFKTRPTGFLPPPEAYYISNHLAAGKNYAIVATKIQDKSGRGLEHFILKITPIARWKTWFSQTP